MSLPTSSASLARRRKGGFGEPSAISRWLDARLGDSAAGFARFAEMLSRRRRLAFEEQADGSFAGSATLRLVEGRFAVGGARPNWRGAKVTFRLSPRRFVFHELELPAQAGAFLEGVVRAQIERITPWRAAEAAFGQSAPVPRGERIAVRVAAARREPIAEIADAAAAAGAAEVVLAAAPEDGAAPIEVMGRQAGDGKRLSRWRFALKGILGASLIAAGAAAAAQTWFGPSLAEREDALTSQIAARRAALMRLAKAGEDPAVEALQRRKATTPAAVLVLEALSKAVPDDAYLTEMRLEGPKLEIAGAAVDAARIVAALEQTPRFSQATFSAPTTRAAEERMELFRIEAQVAPGAQVAPDTQVAPGAGLPK